MKNLPQVLLIAGVAALAPIAAQAQESPHSFTGKVGLYSEYEYRGISQTSEKPALQLNLDYAHASGFYVGTFVSNIKWLKDTAQAGNFRTQNHIEWDIYGGYKVEVAKDLTLDVGYLKYVYPGTGNFHPRPDTDEVYAGLTYGIFNVKYSYSIDDTFGVPNSRKSYFAEANIAWPLPMLKALTLTGHLGHQEFKNNDALSYTVWKLGAVYDLGRGINVGAYVKGTDAESNLYTIQGRDWSKDRLVGFVTYSF